MRPVKGQFRQTGCAPFCWQVVVATVLWLSIVMQAMDRKNMALQAESLDDLEGDEQEGCIRDDVQISIK